MSVWAVVPVKALAHAKRRLTPALDAAGRRRLTRAMLRDVLEVLRATPGLSGVAVVTSERSLVPSGMRHIEDRGDGLNGALRRAAALLEAESATAVLILAADVPLATRDEIETVLAAARRTPVVVVPDRQQRGTNALLLAPPTLLAPAFGDASLARHVALAEARGIEPAILRLSGLSLDVDEVAALAELRRATAGRSGYRFLRAALPVVP